MFPPICDVSVLSKIDLNKPRIEFVTSITTLDNGNKGPSLDLSFLLINDIKMENYPKYLGTTFVSARNVKTTTLDDDLVGYFTDTYDLVVKFPITKTFKKRVHIRSISKFTPKLAI